MAIDEKFEEPFKYLAANLLLLRKQSRMDQISFAEKCGLSRLQYLRAEAGRGILTLQSLLKICQAFQLEMGDLFKDPFHRALRAERRNQIQIQKNPGQVQEEKLVSSMNKNLILRKMTFGKQQIRRMKFQNPTRLELVVLKGELMLALKGELLTLKEGQCLSVEFNPSAVVDPAPSESMKLASLQGGTHLLLIQTFFH